MKWILAGAVVIGAIVFFAPRPVSSSFSESPTARTLNAVPSSRPTKLAIPPHEALPSFQKLTTKAVLTREEKEALNGLYENDLVLGEIQTRLQQTDFDREEEKQRFLAINFLEKAALSPQNERVLTLIERIIEAEVGSTLPLAIKRSIYGDKRELFAILRAQSPTRAQSLLGRLTNPKLRRFLDS